MRCDWPRSWPATRRRFASELLAMADDRGAARPLSARVFARRTADQLAAQSRRWSSWPSATRPTATCRVAVLSSLGEGAGEVLSLIVGRRRISRHARKAASCSPAWPTQIGKQQRPEDIAADAEDARRRWPKPIRPSCRSIVQRLAAQSGHAAGRANRRRNRRQGGDADEVAAWPTRPSERPTKPRRSRPASPPSSNCAWRSSPISRSCSLRCSRPPSPPTCKPPRLRRSASFDAAEVADVVLARFAAFSPRLKGQATDVLALAAGLDARAARRHRSRPAQHGRPRSGAS